MRPPRSFSRRGLLGFAAVTALAFGGCLSPTVPLPPPNRPQISPPDVSGMTVISGSVQPTATAYAENVATGRIVGQVTDDSGRYELELEAKVDDLLVIWYSLGGEESMSLEVSVPGEDHSGQLPPINLGGAAGQ